MAQEPNPDRQFRQIASDLSDVIDEAIIHAIDGHHPDDAVLASLAEARGNIVKMGHALRVVTISIPHDEDRTYADELPPVQQQALPKLQPTQVKRVGIKLKNPTNYDCPRCGAKAGEACHKFSERGPRGVPIEERHDIQGPYHTARQALSSAANNETKRAYDRKHGINNAQR